MDQKLDDIISRKKTARRGAATSRRPRRSAGGGGGARASALGVPDVKVQRAKAAATSVATTPTQPQAEKIQVSGLPTDVSEGQVKDLFASTIGPLREATLHFDSNGRSKGVATITFTRRGDGTKAYQTYNGRLIDGKKPMKIELLFDPTKLAQQTTSLASRVAPAPVPKANGAAVPMEGVQRTGGRPRRGRGRGGKGTVRPKKTAEDLDAEMEEYGKGSGPAAAATATAGGDAQMVVE